ncbi:MAG: hypothetical protein ALECFALPRED_000331 [Alectoria fallacina]|uniref:F-box domain-containing protein n=1 Tax=Alectoria fallacina TaxID=1903189 RepID=A0A8H3PL66_9LECA|nr:MAG: hypothetical protein ALECFALPRED_000331 [Alectoria fallacina]
MELSRMIAVNDMSCYCGSEPQRLPFPLELIIRCLSYLDQARDKRNARLVCKGFAAAGLPSLTSTVYFSTSLIGINPPPKVPHFFCPTREIAMHPVVSKYITKLVCGVDQLPRDFLMLSAFRIWWATISKIQTSWPIQKIHGRYVARYRQEEWMIGNGEDRQIFHTALEHFVKLKRIVFTDVLADEQNAIWARPTWPSAVPEGDLWGLSSPYHTFAMCIRSLSELNIKLHELTIEGGKNAISHCVLSRASSEDYNHLLNVFENLRKIDVNVNTHEDTHPLIFAGLGRLLTHATLVQSLDLRCTGGRQYSRLILSRVFEDATWPHLKHFGLHGFKMHTDVELVAFFDRHRATIESVAFTHMFLHEKHLSSPDDTLCEAWKHFLDELRKRSITFQNLDLLEIYDCHNRERKAPDLASRTGYGVKALQYLRGGGPNPLEWEWDTVSIHRQRGGE